MRSIVTDRVVSSVGLSVCHASEPCKNGCTDRDAFWDVDSGGSNESCVMGVQLKDIALATNFGTKIAINWLCVNDSN